MNNKLKFATLAIFSSVTILTACSDTGSEKNEADNAVVQNDQAEANKAEQQLTKGQTLANILSSTNWQGTRVYDKDNNDLTEENAGFIGLAKYDSETGRYEFFDAKTGKTRGDEGTFFMTNDGIKRILISDTMKYQAVVEITALDEEVFTYKRMGKDINGNDVEVFVEHIPYENDLAFTNEGKTLTTSTGDINTSVDGDEILGKTLWQGTKVLDEKGNDVTEFNGNFLSVAKFEADTNKYEFFNRETGESRGDYGYFDVIHDNKIRAHVAIGENKYGAALELTELNDDKFTYKRVGKDADDNEITIFVEHEPYKGDFKPTFSF
ncbi:DUF4822 domain-containing protein [Lysinibacillus sp. CD3-6]|uniref:DUF4822 domain-containing protein n=1 Tax=Lysinibacillus sp. CD3-6 TaxID=2892541 RepID=UPI00116C119E|nr:DUF4822 domain-containing protein [Lysinibacillus sp. CD3-6]UED80313.1 DUF4822 domain-containing protein [Lysinibacillus sp. CD3-6]